MLLSLPPRALIGAIHLPALPGAPTNRLTFGQILERALADARTLERGGAAACVIENFGDAPFRKDAVAPHVPAIISLIAHQIRIETSLSIGINVLRNDALSALGAAAAANANFIRVNVHSGAALTDQGVIEGQADETLRYRVALGSDVAIAADVDVKHASALVARPLEETADETYNRAHADVLIVSGRGTGKEAATDDIERVRRAVPDAPLWLGSGLTLENLERYRALCDAFIVGTVLHRSGDLEAPLDIERVTAFASALRG